MHRASLSPHPASPWSPRDFQSQGSGEDELPFSEELTPLARVLASEHRDSLTLVRIPTNYWESTIRQRAFIAWAMEAINARDGSSWAMCPRQGRRARRHFVRSVLRQAVLALEDESKLSHPTRTCWDIADWFGEVVGLDVSSGRAFFWDLERVLIEPPMSHPRTPTSPP